MVEYGKQLEKGAIKEEHVEINSSTLPEK